MLPDDELELLELEDALLEDDELLEEDELLGGDPPPPQAVNKNSKAKMENRFAA